MSVLSDLQAKIGQEMGVSDWVEIPQDRINQFAEATEDYQFIHVDVDKGESFYPFWRHDCPWISNAFPIVKVCGNGLTPSSWCKNGYELRLK